jgi:hypothetical protein
MLCDRRGPGDSRANIDRITLQTSWRPQVSWEESLVDLWNDAQDRPRLRQSGKIAAA